MSLDSLSSSRDVLKIQLFFMLFIVDDGDDKSLMLFLWYELSLTLDFVTSSGSC